MFKSSKPAKKTQPRRYDVNKTMSYTSYKPVDAEAPKKDLKPNEVNRPSATAPIKEKRKRRFGFKKAFLLLFIIILTPLLVIGIWDARNAANASEKLFGTRNVAGALLPSQLETASNGRTNILLVGYSVDDPGHEGAALTDSILIVSLDKTDKTGFMLSVPRDLLVDIPDYGSAKINEAFQAGEQQKFSESGYPSGGVGLLQKIVTENFGIPLHYNVIVNYRTVRDVVDALGGVSVNVQSPDPDGLFDPNFKPEEGGPLKLANGTQEIDGQTALRLTRARGSTAGSYGFPQSDFNRTQNQQQVFAAIKKELNLQLVLDPRQNKEIFDALGNNITTDLRLTEMIPLFQLIRSVPDGSLKPINLTDVDGVNLLDSFQTRSGLSALVPAAGVEDFSDIQAVVERLSQ